MTTTRPDLLPRLRAAIRARRLALGLTTTEAGARAGLSQQHWSRLELSDRDVSVTILARAAGALGWSLSRLVREGERG